MRARANAYMLVFYLTVMAILLAISSPLRHAVLKGITDMLEGK